MMPWTGFDASVSSSGKKDERRVKAVTATTMPATQPTRNPMLVPLALGDRSMRMAAMTGIGLSATPSARGRISPITSPTPTSIRPTPCLHPRPFGIVTRQG